MIRKIKLGTQNGLYDDRSLFILADNEKLELEINDIPRGVDCYVNLFNGNKKSKIKYKGLFEVDDKLIFIGELKVSVDFVKEGNIFKHFDIEPLIIKQVESKYEAIPQIEELKGIIAKHRVYTESEIASYKESIDLEITNYKEMINSEIREFKKSIESDIEKLKAVSIL